MAGNDVRWRFRPKRCTTPLPNWISEDSGPEFSLSSPTIIENGEHQSGRSSTPRQKELPGQESEIPLEPKVEINQSLYHCLGELAGVFNWDSSPWDRHREAFETLGQELVKLHKEDNPSLGNRTLFNGRKRFDARVGRIKDKESVKKVKQAIQQASEKLRELSAAVEAEDAATPVRQAKYKKRKLLEAFDNKLEEVTELRKELKP